MLRRDPTAYLRIKASASGLVAISGSTLVGARLTMTASLCSDDSSAHKEFCAYYIFSSEREEACCLGVNQRPALLTLLKA